MHYLSFYTLFILILVVIINAHAPLPTKSFPDADHVSPKNARETPHHHHYDEATWESDDDYDTDGMESRESLCEQAMNMIVQHRNLAQLDPSILLSYCPHYDERLALVLKNHASHGMKKRNPLRRRELKKRLASRFLHKRMS